MTIRELVVKLGIKTDPKGFQRAQAGINAIRNSAFSLGRVFLTGAVAYGFKRMLDVASDIRETANKFGAVFGEQVGPQVQQQLDDISKRTGATSMQLQDMASNIGALIKPALGSAEAAGQMASSVAELALDISSFNNVTSEEALIALRSGLIGSAEPLQRFGVDVRVAALQQEALAQGITTSIQNMTEGQRVALRYAAIQRQLGTQGATKDAERTANDFANASRNLWQAMIEVTGIVMSFLLPAVTKLVNSFRGTIDTLREWFKENRKLVQQRVDKFIERVGRVIAAVGKFFGRIIDATTKWYDGLGETGQALMRIAAIAAALAIALLLPGAPILLLLALIGLIIEDFETWRAGGESVIGDIIGFFNDLVDAIRGGILDTLDELESKFVDLRNGAAKWAEENENAFNVIKSMALGLAIVIGMGLVKAYGAAVASALAFRLWTVKYYAVIAASWLKTQFLMKMAAIKSAAAWLLSTAGLILTTVLLAIIVGTLIYLGSELIKLIKGEENFFSTMHQGISDLIEEWGGVGPAIGAMLDTALRYWLAFFGKSESEIDEWIDNLTETLSTFWENIFDFWTEQFKAFFGWAGDLLAKVGRAVGFDVGTTEEGAAKPGAVLAPQRVTAGPPGTARGGMSVVDSSRNEFNFEVVQQPGMDEKKLAEEFVTLIDQAREKELRQTSYNVAIQGAS